MTAEGGSGAGARKARVDFVGRYENLEQDFAEVARRIGLPSSLVLPRLQAVSRPAGSRDSYRAYYTEETRRVVGDRFGNDVELFQYRFEG